MDSSDKELKILRRWYKTTFNKEKNINLSKYMKKIFLVSTFVALASLFLISSQVKSSAQAGVVAVAWLVNWWNSEVYTCEDVPCSITVTVGFASVTIHGTHQNCVDGSTYAHCWSCNNCDANFHL